MWCTVADGEQGVTYVQWWSCGREGAVHVRGRGGGVGRGRDNGEVVEGESSTC